MFYKITSTNRLNLFIRIKKAFNYFINYILIYYNIILYYFMSITVVDFINSGNLIE